MTSSPAPAPSGPGDEAALAFVGAAHAVDVAAWLAQLPVAEAWDHLSRQDPARQGAVFANLPPQSQAALAAQASRQDLARLVAAMEADDRVDFYHLLPGGDQERLMRDLAPPERDDIRRLSTHAEGCAGAIMTSGYATLDIAMTAGEAIAALRRQAPREAAIYRAYVVDAAHRLTGSVGLHTLILADEAARIGDLMDPAPVAVTVDSDQEDVAKLIARYDLFSIPVVDASGRLVGSVTHDDAADVMQAEATEDFQKISTVLPFRQSLRAAGIGVLYSRRIVWLALLIFGNLFSGAGIAYFEDVILSYVSLVFFLPLLIDSSGNAGAQSATLMVRALATGDVALADWRDLILREMAVAAALGATMAAVVMPIGAWRGGWDVAMTVGATMFVVVILGSLVGMSLPFVLSRLRLDPATASGPLVTTISDGLGVLIYFSIATVVLSL